MTAEASPFEPVYPVQFSVERPDNQSRLTNFPLGVGPFIRSLFLIPHFIILYFFQIVVGTSYFIATFAILFTGRYPEGMFRFYVGYTRWTSNVYGYLASLYDEYPGFSTEDGDYPLTLNVDTPTSSSRILNFPIFGLLLKSVLLIPHYVVIFFLVIAAFVVVVIAQFGILFTGSFPEGMHRFVVGVGRWSTRMTAYQYALTDKYPPFSLS